MPDFFEKNNTPETRLQKSEHEPLIVMPALLAASLKIGYPQNPTWNTWNWFSEKTLDFDILLPDL